MPHYENIHNNNQSLLILDFKHLQNNRMKFLKGLLFFAFISLSVATNAQDIHFTQFYLTPLNTNPAYTGAFEGTFRLSGIYRDQFAGVLNSNPFRTPSFGVDAPLIKGLGKRDWIGVGGVFLLSLIHI